MAVDGAHPLNARQAGWPEVEALLALLLLKLKLRKSR
jgi:hypothetical protein